MSTRAKVEAQSGVAAHASKEAVVAAVEDVVRGGGAPSLVLVGTGCEDTVIGGCVYGDRVIPVMTQSAIPLGRIMVIEEINY